MGENGAFTPLLKSFLEQALDGELDAHLADGDQPNRKNGRGKKRLRTSMGEVEVVTPRNRNGGFQPQVIGKRQQQLLKDLERLIMTRYAPDRYRGSSLGEIHDWLEEAHGVEVSPATISRVTDRLLRYWRSRARGR
ncbi:transposase [Neolewinella xylanilytica]|uniref:transposase n=1 Tax=Neolewinella xylanilytica TaxID=1514080 RepID=UPI003873AADA